MNMNDRNYDSILLLSGIYPEQLYDKLTDLTINKNIQIAADVLQKNIIKGLDSLVASIKLVNAPYIGVFPRGSKIFRFKRSTFSHCRGADDINIPFFNIPILRHFSIIHNSKLEIKRWVNAHPGGTVMAYALTLRNISRLIYAKKIDYSVRTCIIVPDLPLYMRMSAGWVYRRAKKIENLIINRNLPKIDSFVLLTEYMNDIIRSNNYCVVEGISTNCEIFHTQSMQTKIVLYSGTLDKKYGVSNLLQAFHRIKGDNIRLYICGIGDSKKEVEDMAKQDNRICYMGQMSREDIVKLQQSATVLVNPRQNTDEYTKYSFPSKNLEYMSTGVPLIAYKLDGIPDEYDQYIHYVKDNTIEALQFSIEQILNSSIAELHAFGEKARNFVTENKNEYVQARKIFELIMRS